MSGFRREQKEEQKNSGFSWSTLGGAILGGAAAGATLAYFNASYQNARLKHLSEHSSEWVSAQKLLRSDELKPGHLIEFARKNYQHWAIYVGNEKVVHVTNSGMIETDWLIVVDERGRCRVNLLVAKARELGLQQRGTREEIVNYAKQQVGKKVNYHLQKNNCEHFVTECFYGTKFSVQSEILDKNNTVKYLAIVGSQTFPYE